MRYNTVLRAIFSLGIVASTGCLTDPGPAFDPELIVESFEVEIDGSGFLAGPVTLTLHNGGTAALEWWSPRPNFQRRSREGDWMTVWSPGSIPGESTLIPPGESATRTFQLRQQFVSRPGQWSAPYTGVYRFLVYAEPEAILSEPFSFDPG